MKLSPKTTTTAALIGLFLASAGGAYAQNGYFTSPYVFNNDAGSALTITPSAPIGVNPATININDQYTGPFAGANRHDVQVSNDGGLTARTFGIDDSFIFTTTLTLTDGFNSPRKEAGIRFNSNITGDMLFLVNSDAGEIVTFGGPFHLFGNNGGGNGYTPGTPIVLSVKEIGGGDGIGGIPSTIEFSINYNAGFVTTGPLPWTDLEGGPLAYTVGVYAQGGANANGDYVNALFSNTTFTVVPEPTTLALLGLGIVPLIARRFRK